MYTDRNDRGGNSGGYGGGQGGGYGSQAPRQMFTGDWVCGTCGAPIKELPFDPDPNRLGSLKCRDCHRKARDERGGGGGNYRGGSGGQGGGGYRRF